MALTEDDRELIDEQKASGANLKSCIGCGEMLPLTKEFWLFNSDNEVSGNCGDLCKNCMRDKNELALMKTAKQGNLLDKIAKGQIFETTTSEHLYDEVMEVFGGPRSFAASMKLDFDAAKAGSNVRVSIYRMIMNLAAEADKARKGGSTHDLIEPLDLLRQALSVEDKQLSGISADPIEEPSDDSPT